MTEKKKDNPRQIVLDDGRELTIDLRALTWGEADDMVSLYIEARGKKTDASLAARRELAGLLGRVVGLSADEVLALSIVDFAQVNRQVAAFIRDPLHADPN